MSDRVQLASRRDFLAGISRGRPDPCAPRVLPAEQILGFRCKEATWNPNVWIGT